MSDTRHDAQTPLPPPHPGILEPSGAGMLLREARERARLDAGALASMLKVPRARIESLEAGRFDELPDGVYARSLASSICRALRVDASPVLALLPHADARPLDSVAEHKATRIKSASSGARGKFSPSARASTHVSRRALALSALFVVAAGFVVLAPQGAFDKLRSALPIWSDASTGGERRTAEIVNGLGGARVVEEIPVSSMADGAAQPVAPADAAVPSTGPATPGGFAITPAVPAIGAPAADAPAVPAAPAAAADRSVAAANGGLLVISASAPTWIKVADAKGAVLVQKTLGAGQVESVADAATPLSVIVGRTDTTTVQVRGEAFDLSARARNNVARFEVR